MKASWITSTLGYAVIVLTWINQTLVEQGMPASGKEWIAFAVGNIGGLIGVFAKDFNKSNATAPESVARIVPAILVCIVALALTGCGKTLDQVKQAAHNIIEIGGKVYEDAKDNASTVKQALSEAAEEAKVNADIMRKDIAPPRVP